MDKSEKLKVFGERLRGLIDEAGIIHTDFAKSVGLTRATLSNYLTGRSEPKLQILVLLSNFLNTTPNYLLGVSEKETPQSPANAVSLEEIAKRLVGLEQHRTVTDAALEKVHKELAALKKKTKGRSN